MDRNEVTKKIVSVKVKKGMKWETIAKKFSESKEWVVAALLGQMQMTKKQAETDRKSTRLNSSHLRLSRMPSSA